MQAWETPEAVQKIYLYSFCIGKKPYWQVFIPATNSTTTHQCRKSTAKQNPGVRLPDSASDQREENEVKAEMQARRRTAPLDSGVHVPIEQL
jgi:hypothetical protein